MSLDGRRVLTMHSGGKIVAILKKNPKKDPEKYDQGTISPVPLPFPVLSFLFFSFHSSIRK